MLPPYFTFNLSSPQLLQPALLCMQFEDSDNIAAGALIQTILLVFSEFSSCYQRDPER
jgi:hypothetical protein